MSDSLDSQNKSREIATKIEQLVSDAALETAKATGYSFQTFVQVRYALMHKFSGHQTCERQKQGHAAVK